MASPTSRDKPSLHLAIRSRLEKLRQQCHGVCGDVDAGHVKRAAKSGATTVQPLHEFFSSVQLWKERSLHHTLEALDRAGAASVDSHIEAMELHEKGAKDLFELTGAFLDRTWRDVNQHLDTFAGDLAGLVDEIVTSRLDEQRLAHDRIVKGLKDENERLERTCHALEGTNGELEDRLEVLENTPSAGGDAILCNKLRGRVQRLVTRQRALSAELEVAAQERVKHRRDLEKTKAQLADTQKSLALTRAMHDKETRQLAALVQLNHAQVVQVLEASRAAAANAESRRLQQPLERFDPLSGCMIVHLAPVAPPQKPPGSASCTSPRRSSTPVLATSSSQSLQGAAHVSSRPRPDRPKSAVGSRTRSTSTANEKTAT